ncbi:MAG: hypothetical protein M0R18_09715 [Deltaproteobacteria bacterium]|jgi:hypothetical protein|nr:hypothetical protein [Deltaproteobacteria bacterium]MDX9762615.1 hypothetical protein [Desulfomonilia bacterium]
MSRVVLDTNILVSALLLNVLNLFLMLSYPEELDQEINKSGSLRESFLSVWKNLVFTLRGQGALRATTNVCIYDGFYNAVKDFLQPIVKTLALTMPLLLTLQAKQRSAVLVGIVYFFIYLMTSWASRCSGAFASCFKTLTTPQNLTMLAGFGLGILCSLAYYFRYSSAAVVLFTVISVIQNLRSPMSVTYVSDTVPCEVLATSLSVRSLITAFYTAIMALVIGLLADHLGLGQALMVLSFGLTVFSPLYLVSMEKHTFECEKNRIS